MSVRPDIGLERLIHGLEQELLSAADEEFVAGARDLGMKPEMKGSAAFVGVKNYSTQLLTALRMAYAELPHGKTQGADSATESEPAAPERGGRPKRNVDA